MNWSSLLIPFLTYLLLLYFITRVLRIHSSITKRSNLGPLPVPCITASQAGLHVITGFQVSNISVMACVIIMVQQKHLFRHCPQHARGPIKLTDICLQTWKEGTWGFFRRILSIEFPHAGPLLVSAVNTTTSKVPYKADILQIRYSCSICSMYIYRKQLCSRASIIRTGNFLTWNPIHM